MERNIIQGSSSGGLRWENLALGSGRPIDEIPQTIGFSMSSSDSNNSNGSSSKYPFAPTYDDIVGPSGKRMTGLNLGRHKEFRDSFSTSSTRTACTKTPAVSSIPAPFPIPSTPTKRSRASYQNMQNPCCQVEGCNLDLKSAKDYHRRHRICESHSKSPKVIVAGMERRFCQQCSRFHELSEFDDKKRSCRRRLSDHNARRRRVQPESVQLSSSGLSSALYDQRQQNVLLNGLPISLSNPRWENGSTSMLRYGLIRPSKAGGGLEGTPRLSSDEIHNPISNLRMDLERLSSIHSSNPGVLDQCLHVPATHSPIASDLLNSHSLLSSNSWSLNEGESNAMDGLDVHGNYNNPQMRHTNNLSLFHSNNNNIPTEEEGASVSLLHSVNLHNAGNSHQQEYRLFKAPYESGSFYSS